ncbi:MAG: DUF4143 domain-containing protein, partial [Acidobacteria bacterium]|nr:DUF4143 domain-containing protein [Acidobacteriota bacterium]
MALETLFLQEARALNDYERLGYQFYYWRTPNQLEVDFVLYGERGLKAFEIKKPAHLRSQDFAGLKQFLSDRLGRNFGQCAFDADGWALQPARARLGPGPSDSR